MFDYSISYLFYWAIEIDREIISSSAKYYGYRVGSMQSSQARLNNNKIMLLFICDWAFDLNFDRFLSPFAGIRLMHQLILVSSTIRHDNQHQKKTKYVNVHHPMEITTEIQKIELSQLLRNIRNAFGTFILKHITQSVQWNTAKCQQ